MTGMESPGEGRSCPVCGTLKREGYRCEKCGDGKVLSPPDDRDRLKFERGGHVGRVAPGVGSSPTDPRSVSSPVDALSEIVWSGQRVGDDSTCLACGWRWPQHDDGCFAGELQVGISALVDAATTIAGLHQAGGNEWWEAHAKLYRALNVLGVETPYAS